MSFVSGLTKTGGAVIPPAAFNAGGQLTTTGGNQIPYQPFNAGGQAVTTAQSPTQSQGFVTSTPAPSQSSSGPQLAAVMPIGAASSLIGGPSLSGNTAQSLLG